MRIYFFVDQEPSSFILATMVPSYGNIWGVGYSFNLTPNRSVDFYYFSLNGLLNDDGIFYKQGCQQGCRWGCWWCCQSKKDAANKDAGDAGEFSYSWSLIASIGRLVLFLASISSWLGPSLNVRTKMQIRSSTIRRCCQIRMLPTRMLVMLASTRTRSRLPIIIEMHTKLVDRDSDSKFVQLLQIKSCSQNFPPLRICSRRVHPTAGRPMAI